MMSRMETPPWYVVTGAPSAGKSTLIAELSRRGYRTVDEAARFVIEREVAAGRDYRELRVDASAFQHEVLQMKVDVEASLPSDVIIFLDRGIPDSAAFFKHEGVPEDEALRAALAKGRYRKVFVLDLISRENFVDDGVRSETWESALELDRLLEQAYRERGYDVVRIPAVSVSERADMIERSL
jgi:predicted ATPase